MYLWSTHRAKFIYIYYIRCFAWVIYIACATDQAGPTKRPLSSSSIGIVVRSNLAHAKNRHHHHQKPGIQLFCAPTLRVSIAHTYVYMVYSNCVHSHNSFDTLTHTPTLWYLNEPIRCVRIAIQILSILQCVGQKLDDQTRNILETILQHKMRVYIYR